MRQELCYANKIDGIGTVKTESVREEEKWLLACGTELSEGVRCEEVLGETSPDDFNSVQLRDDLKKR